MQKRKSAAPTPHKYSLLRQICNYIPTFLVSKLAAATGVDEKARTFSPWSHVVALLYAQRVKLQRSENLVDWEDWQTMILGGDGCGIIDTPGTMRQRFYRAVEDTLTPMNAP